MTRRKACRIQVSTAIQGGIRPAALGRVRCRFRSILLHMATLHARITTSTRPVSSSQLAAGDSAASRLSSSRLRVTAEDEATQVLEAKVRVSIAMRVGTVYTCIHTGALILVPRPALRDGSIRAASPVLRPWAQVIRKKAGCDWPASNLVGAGGGGGCRVSPVDGRARECIFLRILNRVLWCTFSGSFEEIILLQRSTWAAHIRDGKTIERVPEQSSGGTGLGEQRRTPATCVCGSRDTMCHNFASLARASPDRFARSLGR